ncbi:hypothetical protein GCM10027572_00540 [Flexivirga lutea]
MECIDTVGPNMFPKGELFGPYRTHPDAVDAAQEAIREGHGGSAEITRETSTRYMVDYFRNYGC